MPHEPQKKEIEASSNLWGETIHGLSSGQRRTLIHNYSVIMWAKHFLLHIHSHTLTYGPTLIPFRFLLSYENDLRFSIQDSTRIMSQLHWLWRSDSEIHLQGSSHDIWGVWPKETGITIQMLHPVFRWHENTVRCHFKQVHSQSVQTSKEYTTSDMSWTAHRTMLLLRCNFIECEQSFKMGVMYRDQIFRQ